MFKKLKNSEDRLELIAEQLKEFEVQHPMIVFLIFWFALLSWLFVSIAILVITLVLMLKGAMVLFVICAFVFIFSTLPIGYWLHIDNIR